MVSADPATKKGIAQRQSLFLGDGAPGEIRTPDHLVRSQVLYPTELRALEVAYYLDATTACQEIRFICIWRRERDSNPRWAFDPYALSRGAPSASRPSLQFFWAPRIAAQAFGVKAKMRGARR